MNLGPDILLPAGHGACHSHSIPVSDMPVGGARAPRISWATSADQPHPLLLMLRLTESLLA